jgi:hypothetical protein
MQDKKAPKEYKFTTEEMALLNDIAEQIKALQHQQEGALKLIMRQHKLEGEWRWAGDRLVEQVVQVEVMK